MPPAGPSRSIIVIGGGPAGSELAALCAERGHHVDAVGARLAPRRPARHRRAGQGQPPLPGLDQLADRPAGPPRRGGDASKHEATASRRAGGRGRRRGRRDRRHAPRARGARRRPPPCPAGRRRADGRGHRRAARAGRVGGRAGRTDGRRRPACRRRPRGHPRVPDTVAVTAGRQVLDRRGAGPPRRRRRADGGHGPRRGHRGRPSARGPHLQRAALDARSLRQRRAVLRRQP